MALTKEKLKYLFANYPNNDLTIVQEFIDFIFEMNVSFNNIQTNTLTVDTDATITDLVVQDELNVQGIATFSDVARVSIIELQGATIRVRASGGNLIIENLELGGKVIVQGGGLGDVNGLTAIGTAAGKISFFEENGSNQLTLPAAAAIDPQTDEIKALLESYGLAVLT